MNKSMFAAVVMLGVMFFWQPTRAADNAPASATTIHGVLIDTMCGSKMEKKDDPDAAAAGHDKACAIKCSSSGYSVINGKKMIKFDENGNKLAKDYLAKEDSKTKVVVEGKMKGEDTIEVTSLKADSGGQM